MNDSDKLEIQLTADGSPTLYRKDMDEHYHSVKGALTESQHVYIALGWEKGAESLTRRPMHVFEVGFGTGLNCALTADAATTKEIPTLYSSIELYPIASDMADSLFKFDSPSLADLILRVNDAQWNIPVDISPYFKLNKISADLLTTELPSDIDIVYFDAFAPEKQPEIWSPEVFRKIYEAMTPGGILTTYCAKGAIRRLLQSIGFLTERLPGPPGGKREVLRATKPA